MCICLLHVQSFIKIRNSNKKFVKIFQKQNFHIKNSFRENKNDQTQFADNNISNTSYLPEYMIPSDESTSKSSIIEFEEQNENEEIIVRKELKTGLQYLIELTDYFQYIIDMKEADSLVYQKEFEKDFPLHGF